MAASLLASSACSKGRDEGPGTTVPPGGGAAGVTNTTADAATTATVAAVSYEVPEVIDQAYVQRVVNAYDKVLGDAIRILKRDGAITEDFLEHLLAIYTEDEFESQQRGWLDALAGGDLEKRPPVPSDPITRIVRVARLDAKCITIEVDRDFRPTISSGQVPAESPEPDYLVLVAKKDGRDPAALNPTPWVMAFDGFKQDGSEPVNSCDD